MNQRVNLFKDLVGTKTTTRTIPWPAITAYAGAAIVVTWALATFVSYQMNARDMKRLIQSAKVELKKLEDMDTTSTAQYAVKSINNRETQLKYQWELIVWNISNMTIDGVELEKMALDEVAPSKNPVEKAKPQPSYKQVKIEGRAQSMPALKKWLDGLADKLSSYDFELTQQDALNGVLFPYRFIVLAKIL